MATMTMLFPLHRYKHDDDNDDDNSGGEYDGGDGGSLHFP